MQHIPPKFMPCIELKSLQGLEKYVMTKLFSRTFSSFPEDAKTDLEVSQKIHLLQTFLKPEHLDIPLVLRNEASWLVSVLNFGLFHIWIFPVSLISCQFYLVLCNYSDPMPYRLFAILDLVLFTVSFMVIIAESTVHYSRVIIFRSMISIQVVVFL